jgi:hypothetical protein
MCDSLLQILPDNPYSFALSYPRFPCSQGRNTGTEMVSKTSVYCGIMKYVTIKQLFNALLIIVLKSKLGLNTENKRLVPDGLSLERFARKLLQADLRWTMIAAA